jgi:hypothetical protein
MRFILPMMLLLLTLPSVALTDDQSQMLDKIALFYKSVGMNDKAAWLAEQRKLNRISFEKFTGDEVHTSAITDSSTKEIRVNENLAKTFTYRNYVDLGVTLSHERIHQDQSSLAVIAARCKQAAGYGNKAEQEGWAEGLTAGRKVVMTLRKQLAKATSSRDKIILGKRLQQAAESWQNHLNDWNVQKKKYGDFPSTEFQDSDGMFYTVEDMLKESKQAMKVARDNLVPATHMVSQFPGKYRGKAVGGAVGTFNFDIRADYSVVGTVKGNHKMGSFDGVIDGGVDVDGLLRGGVSGTIKTRYGVEKFSGTFSGKMTKSGAQGRWTAGAEGVYPSGDWMVTKL